MYSRNVRMSTDERYAKNIPPVYGGSRFYRAPPPAETETPVRTAHDGGIAVQYEARPKESTPIEAEVAETEEAAVPPRSADDVEMCADSRSDACTEEPQTKETFAPCEENTRHGGFLQTLVSGDQEELLLIAILLLLCGEQDRAADMIVILLLLIIVR